MLGLTKIGVKLTTFFLCIVNTYAWKWGTQMRADSLADGKISTALELDRAIHKDKAEAGTAKSSTILPM